MKKTIAVCLVSSFLLFVSTSAYAGASTREFSLKDTYNPTLKVTIDPDIFAQTGDTQSIQEEIAALKKKKSGFMIGGVLGVLAGAGLIVLGATTENTSSRTNQLGEELGQREDDVSAAKTFLIGGGLLSLAFGGLMFGSMAKAGKQLKQKEAELNNLAALQAKLAAQK
ncbi:MAG: hypothetical protein ABIK95_07975 [Acidobacteriota bacterium]